MYVLARDFRGGVVYVGVNGARQQGPVVSTADGVITGNELHSIKYLRVHPRGICEQQLDIDKSC